MGNRVAVPAQLLRGLRLSASCASLLAALLALAPLSASPMVHLVTRNGLSLAPVILVDDAGESHNVYLQIDTGSSDTLIDKSLLPEGRWQTREDSSALRTTEETREVVQRLALQRLEIGSLVVQSPVLPLVSGLIDPSPVGEGPTSMPVVGVLGADILFSRSCYLSLSQQRLTWTEDPPFDATEVKTLIWIPGGMWAVKGYSLDATESVFLIDTGTFDSFMPQEAVESTMRQDPGRWMTWSHSQGEPFYASTATVAWKDPLSIRPRLQEISGLPSVVTSSIGTAALVSHDLWFKIRGFMMATLSVRNAEEDQVSRFLSTVDLSVWGQEPQTWGFRVSPVSGLVTWLGSFLNQGPVVPELAWGDRLLSIDGTPWGPEGIQKLPAGLETLQFSWVDRFGKQFSLNLSPRRRGD